MGIPKEKVKLDEVLKFLFSTSKKVLIKLLNGIFDENFNEDEVDLTVTNNEFIEDTLSIIRGDMFFEINDKDNKVASYHLEFQTINDKSMVIRMFEYGFRKAKENYKQDICDKSLKTVYFPKQKVIFFEKNGNIKDLMNLKIIFPDNQELLYSVEVIKYWELTDEYIIQKKMYPLLPLQLFNLRKDLEIAHKKNNIERIKELSYIAKDLASKLATEAKQLLDEDEILAEDFHKMLLAIQNLIEYLNRNYFNDERIEEEVTTMTKTLIDPEVEKKAIERIAKNLLDVLDNETISAKTGLTVEFIEALRKQ